ncbi:MAG: hypothetical protein UR39_C0003G0068 [Candidatus Woesebacteria bacterium GW2011_GWA1_33_30]|uniref:Uncharacterized protein n=1 Tax=Candidatus Woesebacteria bacterium GW2011_GWA2_33_28 TaxID=1618561 RepID=A0A0G0A8S7_9BACT|nr:MAG: hypothetical protein UR38_C0003G0071 [Candidatus Woesebacteria bacterium GW2011_GWA2_33_28]KKP48533.1 MAG: hypothetical protein UR39_C0003G0068 [Candidatus Woesebacteria bacterium GW2011_GWA1_33_30]KKP49672.1 MAG: hypothetical protein UR40_C0004G0071 [Microgenomates group bacterium GW2011_GWC1_33_32]KKP52289.1 MAG: hypothetical protein UR44_C0003G0071 [Candidatus Woesebacteria bacterium GW2011_GWB1_33_38]KKP58120.1 MAG: hypothetical protein UR48_C0007G0010 [Microgenomates group bacteriu
MSLTNQYLQVITIIFIGLAWFLAFKASTKNIKGSKN